MRRFNVWLCLALMLTFTVSGCRRVPPQWVESPLQDGRQMEPDHGWFYYYMMMNLLRQDSRPTYHVWMPTPDRPYYNRMDPRYAQSPPRAYQTGPGTTYRPSTPGLRATPAVPFRSSGGFSSPAPRTYSSPSFRSGGGFSRPSTPSRSYRSGGGFRR